MHKLHPLFRVTPYLLPSDAGTRQHIFDKTRSLVDHLWLVDRLVSTP